MERKILILWVFPKQNRPPVYGFLSCFLFQVSFKILSIPQFNENFEEEKNFLKLKKAYITCCMGYG